MGAQDPEWGYTVNLWEKVNWDKTRWDMKKHDMYYGLPPRRIIMRTVHSYWIESHQWCPGCKNWKKVCPYHEYEVGRKKYLRMRDVSPKRPRRGAINHK